MLSQRLCAGFGTSPTELAQQTPTPAPQGVDEEPEVDHFVADCSINSTVLRVLSIGDSKNPELMEAQRRTLGEHVALRHFTADNVTPNCTGLCDPMQTHVACEAWLDQPEGWWCAQKLPLAALAMVLRATPTIRLPYFILIIDDDTVVNPCMLKKFLLDEEQGMGRYKLYAGAPDYKNRFIHGGGGVVLSRAVLRALRGTHRVNPRRGVAKNEIRGNVTMPIDLCVDNQHISNGWCSYHSDWAEGKCIEWHAAIQPTGRHDLFAQFDEGCQLNKITCHQQKTPELHDAWYTLYRQRYWSQIRPRPNRRSTKPRLRPCVNWYRQHRRTSRG